MPLARSYGRDSYIRSCDDKEIESSTEIVASYPFIGIEDRALMLHYPTTVSDEQYIKLLYITKLMNKKNPCFKSYCILSTVTASVFSSLELSLPMACSMDSPLLYFLCFLISLATFTDDLPGWVNR